MKRTLTTLFRCIVFYYTSSSVLSESDEGGYTFVNKVRYPFSPFYDPFMGLIIAFDIKLEESYIDADFAWNMEANYFLPQNESEYSFPPIIPSEESSERDLFDRRLIYEMIEHKLNDFIKKYAGKKCLLRIICEMSLHTTKGTDILGDILHILLSPSSSIDENLPRSYLNAELYGNKQKHCAKYVRQCPADILSIFSVLGQLLDNN